MRILLVEDDEKIASVLDRGLTEEGHDVVAVPTLSRARMYLDVRDFELLLVDRMLPDGDGLDLVREARKRSPRTAILCLTARDRIADRVEGLYGGADDYIVKPFDFAELVARIAAIARRSGVEESIRVGALEIDPQRHQARVEGEALTLTPREFALLRCLAEDAGRVLSRADILSRVWQEEGDPGHNVVDVYISFLRKKLRKAGAGRMVHTVRGVGYVLEARS